MTVLDVPNQQHGPSDSMGIRPLDPPRARASGPAPYRILAVGGDLLAGHGVLTHDLALTGSLARGLARLLGHGVDVQSVVAHRTTLAATARALRSRDLSRIDALVLVLDQVGDRWHVARAATRVNKLVEDLSNRMVPGASITLVVPPRAVWQRSERDMATLAMAVRDGAAALTRVVHLTGRLQVQGHAQLYKTWAETIATSMAESLIDPLVWLDAVDQIDEPRRQTAVRRLGPLDAGWQAAFRRIVEFSSRAYGTSCASISIVDGDRTRYLSRRGFDIEALEREQSLCELALRTHGGLIVGDAKADPRFNTFPVVQSGQVRFYAGYRIESPDGQPVGVVCVFDDQPRPVLSQDIALLRDFATAAERRIWELMQGTSPARP